MGSQHVMPVRPAQPLQGSPARPPRAGKCLARALRRAAVALGMAAVGLGSGGAAAGAATGAVTGTVTVAATPVASGAGAGAGASGNEGRGARGVEASPQALRLAVSDGPVSLPIYVAQAKGYFEREGLAVQLQACASGRQCFELLRERKADVATAAELVMTLNGLAGSDAAIIATISASTQHIKLVAHAGAGILSPADLRGKRIATVRGTSAQYFLDSWLVFHAIDPKDVTVVALPPEQLAGALQRREVQAVAIWEPAASAAIDALGADARVLQSPRVYTQHFSLIASREALRTRDAALLRLLRALAQAERLIAAEPAEARRILRAALRSEPGSESMAVHDYRLTLAQSLIGTMDGQARWARREGLAAAGRDAADLLRCIEPALLRRAVPGAVSLP